MIFYSLSYLAKPGVRWVGSNDPGKKSGSKFMFLTYLDNSWTGRISFVTTVVVAIVVDNSWTGRINVAAFNGTRLFLLIIAVFSNVRNA